jgi:alanine racemase
MAITHRCWAEVDLSALRENLAWIRHRVVSDVKVITVVKADAYGHGLKPIATVLMQSGTDIFGVANLAEAQAIRSVGKGWPILMLGACLPHEIPAAVRDQVMPTISSIDEAEKFSTAAARFGQRLAVHVKVDTGMGRIGVKPHDALALLQKVAALPSLELQGIYTHFSSVEDDAPYSRGQLKVFSEVLHMVKASGIEIPIVHANNSGGLLFESRAMFNAIRPGLLVFGVLPPASRKMSSQLKHNIRPALSWKCRVSFIKEVAKGTPLSYGRTFTARKSLRVATLTAGYGDGYLRAGSNRAHVLVGSQRCRVLGRITMDQILVDVSHVPEVRPGDEAVLIGAQGKEAITANELASWCNTVPWEILTAITYRVPRIYTGGQAA